MNPPNKKQRKTKVVLWYCDKSECGQANTRTIFVDNVINDDTCDSCKRAIHEPVTITTQRQE